MNFSKTRGALYQVARLMGDVNAVRGGPDKMIQRLIRRQTGRLAGRGMGKAFRKLFK